MAKRAPIHEAAYDPLDQNLAKSVMTPTRPAPAERLLTGGYAGPEAHRIERGGKTVPEPEVNRNLGVRGITRTKRVLLTPEEERDIERLVDRVAECIGASLKFSHLLRACMSLLCHAEAEITRHATAHPMARPANGDSIALAQFEQRLARLLSLALREAPPIR